ncbi:MAG: hypothetical protein ACK4N5_12010 [Myxococcales bacterium]
MARMPLNREKFLDLLCERWLFERNGVELYDRVVDKLDRHGHHDEARALRRFRDEEDRHRVLLESVIAEQGGDVGRETPSQMPVRVESRAFERIVADARGPIALLHVLLAAELEDHAGWELLIALAREVGQREVADAFASAFAEETAHLEGVKRLLAEQTRRELSADAGAAEPLIPLI